MVLLGKLLCLSNQLSLTAYYCEIRAVFCLHRRVTVSYFVKSAVGYYCKIRAVSSCSCIIILCYFTCIFYAVVRQIFLLFIDNKDSVFGFHRRVTVSYFCQISCSLLL